MTDTWNSAISVFRVTSSASAEQFYVGGLGFKVLFVYRPDFDRTDPAYIGLERGAVRLHVSSFSGDGVAGSVINIYVNDVDAVLAMVKTLPLARVDLPPTLQTWGNREMYVRDPDGNCLRFIQPQ